MGMGCEEQVPVVFSTLLTVREYTVGLLDLVDCVCDLCYWI